MHKLVTLPTLLALSIGLVACANQPNQNLEDARSSYSALQADSRASKLAALETQDAGNMLDKANKAYLNDADEKTVDQLAYLTKRRIELAEQTIALRSAEEELGKTRHSAPRHAWKRARRRSASCRKTCRPSRPNAAP